MSDYELDEFMLVTVRQEGESMAQIQDGGRVIFSLLAGLGASELSETAPWDRLSGWVRAPVMCRDLLANVSQCP